MSVSKIASSLFVFIGTVSLLYVGRVFILPLAIAVLIFFIIEELKKLIGFINIRGFMIPEKLRTFLAFGLIVFFLFFFGNLLYLNIQSIYEVLPQYQENILFLTSSFTKFQSLDLALMAKEFLSGDFITKAVRLSLESISGVLSSSLLILLYLIFILLERRMFVKKIQLMYKDEMEYNNIHFILDNIYSSISRYISLKTVTSISTGLLSYLVLIMLGIDFAFFWAFLIFILNFIPTIGSLIATVFPAIIALLQYGNFSFPLIVLASIGFIQFMVGNVIEPRLMGNSLNVSPLVVLLSLTFWGVIWGVTGMVLSVPITIVIIITSSQFESTKWIALLLSENGEVLTKD